jgi:deoxyadenosine/deoxycytidine kinase
MTCRIFTIDGNIGSGKSTLLNNLKHHYRNSECVVFVNEPVDEWEAIKDANCVTILEKFYKDQKKWGFSFQMMAYVSRLNAMRKIIKDHPESIIITERSLYTDRHVFAKMLFDAGLIEDVNYQIYLRWFDDFIEEYSIHGCIYVKTDPQICFNRIKTRSRSGESNIPLEYLNKCSEYHDYMVKELHQKFKFNVLELDGNQDIFNDPSLVSSWINKIDAYVNA